MIFYHLYGTINSSFVNYNFIFLIYTFYRRNQELIKELSSPPPGSNDLYFPTKYSQSFFVQCKACFWKQFWSYWRNPSYNAVRFFFTIVVGIVYGIIFWNKAKHVWVNKNLHIFVLKCSKCISCVLMILTFRLNSNLILTNDVH